MSRKDSEEESALPTGRVTWERWWATYGTGPAPTPAEFRDRLNGLLAEIGAAPLDPRHGPLEPDLEPKSDPSLD